MTALVAASRSGYFTCFCGPTPCGGALSSVYVVAGCLIALAFALARLFEDVPLQKKSNRKMSCCYVCRSICLSGCILSMLPSLIEKTMTTHTIRTLESGDYEYVSSVVDEWWGGRPVRALVHRIFFDHLNATSYAIGPSDAVQAFLIGFVSQSKPNIAYIHFVGVTPAARADGLARMLYEHFFNVVGARGCTEVHSITSVVNTASIAFHRKLGFTLLPGSGEIDGLPVALNYAGEGQHRVRFHKSL
ncbi:hypothetical protein CAter282_3713 [Collimonas arenae]|uniref:N-acetyltransferase domain-containing protein n=1 Tax=Collimonas arenae TaxID=279058 RepID=A0A127QN51_9BURK|nr:GNAT family N-acetyltransferase [Collimonas arenae]AMP01496.1 hypothetical protein CAter10_4059 [Collimonas arenae]AMP11396.1 hypothetical protein CAter282_3713 [Collimonas arenae]